MARLNNRSRIATFVEEIADFLWFWWKIRVVTTTTTKSKKLRIWNEILDMWWMWRWIQHEGCKTCPFISNVEKISGPKRSIKITDHFTCTSANVIYCVTWIARFAKSSTIGETGRRIDDRFREHLRDVEKDDQNASKPVARHLNLPNHSKQHMAVWGVSLHQGGTES